MLAIGQFLAVYTIIGLGFALVMRILLDALPEDVKDRHPFNAPKEYGTPFWVLVVVVWPYLFYTLLLGIMGIRDED